MFEGIIFEDIESVKIIALSLLLCLIFLWRQLTFLRLVSFALLLLALANPVQKSSDNSNILYAGFDWSDSLRKETKLELIKKALTYLDNHELRAFTFSDKLSSKAIKINNSQSAPEVYEQLEEISRNLNKKESKISESLKELKEHTSSLLLFSDGQEQKKVNFSGLRVFPIIVDHKLYKNEDVRLISIENDSIVNAESKTDILVNLQNNSDKTRTKELLLEIDDKLVQTKIVNIPANSSKKITFLSPKIKGGKHKITASVGDKKVYSWINAQEKSKVLVLSHNSSYEKTLINLLKLKGFKTESYLATSKIPTKLAKYRSIIMNNISKKSLPSGFLANLKQYVSKGGSLLTIGGNRSYANGGYKNTELEEITPLTFSPPKKKQRRLINAIALVLDKSGSMIQQNKIGSAKKAALSSINSLKPEDYITVIGFDHAPFVIIDIAKISTIKASAENRLRNLTAVGKTNLLPALSAARQKLASSPASRKHIIVLSDGKFPLSSDLYVREIKKLGQKGITISTVALGLEANVPFLKLLAKSGKGAFYHTVNATSLPEIFVEDIKVNVVKEPDKQSDFPVNIGSSGVKSTRINRFPSLKGFNETKVKNRAKEELITKEGSNVYPILSSWKYNKGKVISYTSDLTSNWATNWLRWKNFSQFWSDIFNNLGKKDKNKDIDFELRHNLQGEVLNLDLAIFNKNYSKNLTAILKDKNLNTKLNFKQISPGRYVSKQEIKKSGDYFLELRSNNTAFPEIGINVDKKEEKIGLDLSYLQNLALKTSGEINPEEVNARNLSRENKIYYNLYLIISAFMFLLLDAFIRESRT